MKTYTYPNRPPIRVGYHSDPTVRECQHTGWLAAWQIDQAGNQGGVVYCATCGAPRCQVLVDGFRCTGYVGHANVWQPEHYAKEDV